MEANVWTLVIVGAIIVVMVVLILIRNKRDKDEFYKSLHAGEDQSLLLEKDTSELE
jgi:FtsZ-interacting cell division protein ZipA